MWSNVQRNIVRFQGVYFMHARYEGINKVVLPPCPQPALLNYPRSLPVGSCKWLAVNTCLGGDTPDFCHQLSELCKSMIAVESNSKKQPGMRQRAVLSKVTMPQTKCLSRKGRMGAFVNIEWTNPARSCTQRLKGGPVCYDKKRLLWDYELTSGVEVPTKWLEVTVSMRECLGHFNVEPRDRLSLYFSKVVLLLNKWMFESVVSHGWKSIAQPHLGR